MSVNSRVVSCQRSWGPRFAWSSVSLGSDFEPGAAYTVRVNDETRRFTGGFDGVEWTEVVAHIENAALGVTDSDPPQYFVELGFYLPIGCDTLAEKRNVLRSGASIEVSVVNRIVGKRDTCDGGPQLMERESVELGSDFQPGKVYTVRVNDWETFFRADSTALLSTIKAERPKLDTSFRPPQPIPEQFPPLLANEARWVLLDPNSTVVRGDRLQPTALHPRDQFHHRTLLLSTPLGYP